MWWNRKEWRRNKDFKKWGKLGQGVGALKRGGAGTPLTNYVTHALNILLECIERNIFTIGEQFNVFLIPNSLQRKMID